MSGKWTGESLSYVLPRAPGQTDTWTEETAGHRGSQELIEVGEVAPPANVAEMLSLAAGEQVVVRRRRMRLGDEPVELVTSYYPQRVAAGTALGEHRKVKGGAPTVLAELGYRAARVEEYVEARTPTEEERSALELGDRDPVLILSRLTLSQDDEPVEVSVMVMKASKRRLHYEIEVD
jgi:GntR family transcriptional regulator